MTTEPANILGSYGHRFLPKLWSLALSQRSNIPISMILFGAAAVVLLAPYAGCHILTSRPMADVPLAAAPSAAQPARVAAQDAPPSADSDATRRDSGPSSSGLSEIEQLLSK